MLGRVIRTVAFEHFGKSKRIRDPWYVNMSAVRRGLWGRLKGLMHAGLPYQELYMRVCRLQDQLKEHAREVS
eukprot:15367718-Alexandrium_andersonii.AAC.1